MLFLNLFALEIMFANCNNSFVEKTRLLNVDEDILFKKELKNSLSRILGVL